MYDHEESASSALLAKTKCRVKVVMNAPEIEDYLSDNVRRRKLESEDLPVGWERWSLPRNGKCSTVIISPGGRKFDRRGKLKKYVKSSRIFMNQPIENISIQPPNASHSRIQFLSQASKQESENKNKKKGKKRLEFKRCSVRTKFPNKSPTSKISINPSTVRDRRRNLHVLEAYNHNHEDDIFECLDTSSIHTKVLLNSSSSSSGSSSPSLSRRASPSILPELTRESTPQQLRGLLNNNKDETTVSGNRYYLNIFCSVQSICTFICIITTLLVSRTFLLSTES